VCSACCNEYITDGAQCDQCVSQQCFGAEEVEVIVELRNKILQNPKRTTLYACQDYLTAEWQCLKSGMSLSQAKACSPKGVTFDNETQRILAIEIIGCGLSGTIPDFSKNLALTDLTLWSGDDTGGKLTGTIPSFAANTALRNLQLQQNHLTGTIPSFAEHTALEALRLDRNQLTGNVATNRGDRS